MTAVSTTSATQIRTSLYATPIGSLLLVASDKGLREISILNKNSEQDFSHDDTLDPYYDQIQEYFEGRREAFDLPLDPVGTDFQKAVWTAVSAIPYGQTVFYEDIARRIGSPLAMRAVGTALKMNPLWIVVPCHRVLPKSGGMGGYAGGVERKEWLLRHERAHA